MKSRSRYLSRFTATLLAISFALLGIAQPEPQTEPEAEANPMIIEALDSLTYLFYSSRPRTTYSSRFEADEVPVYSDSVYAYRLATIPSPMPMVYNSDVRQYIRLYTEVKRSAVERMLGLAELYFPLFEETLDKYGLPLELKYLPIIESALNANAVSRAGATGLWQFMYTTGKMYGLKINSYVDERRDPRLATDAACRFLKELYEMYGDWSLVLAAYNSGPGNVNKAMRRSGGKTTYWEIRHYLPRETRGYVPAFIGATYALAYHQDHNLAPELFDIYFEPTDTVHVREAIDLARIAEHLGMGTDELHFLNPALRRQHIPFTGEPYPLVVPMNKLVAFEGLRDTLLAEAQAVVQPAGMSSGNVAYQTVELQSTSSTASAQKPRYPSTSRVVDTRGKTKLVYTVKSGDNLGYISEWYGVRVSEIQNWNNLYGTRIRVGQKLDIYVKDEVVNRYKNMDRLSFEQKQGTKSAPTSGSASSGVSIANSTQYIQYTIKSGDTLWDISKRYPKNSVEDLKRINNITDLRVIKPGYVIKVAI